MPAQNYTAGELMEPDEETVKRIFVTDELVRIAMEKKLKDIDKDHPSSSSFLPKKDE